MNVVFSPEVQGALDRGEPWRAKELLQGRLGTFSPELYAQYGALLLHLRDLPEAGRFLFLSGKLDPEFAEAVSLYLRRHGSGSWKLLAASFPKGVRGAPISALPNPVRAALIERGLRVSELQPGASLNDIGRVTPAPPTPQQRLQLLSCLVIALLAIASMIAGVPVLISKMARLFSQ